MQRVDEINAFLSLQAIRNKILKTLKDIIQPLKMQKYQG